MKVAITGASGFIGSALCEYLSREGHTVVPIRRRGASMTSHDQVEGGIYLEGEDRRLPLPWWDPISGEAELSAVNGFEALIHLGGEPIASRRWSTKQRRLILTSRTNGTSAVVQAMRRLSNPPLVFVCASAIGIYGNRGGETLLEDSRPGEGFLAGVCMKWEENASQAGEFTRVVSIRTSLVLDSSGGLLKRLLPLYKVGLGARLGRGNQFMGWISLADEVRAIAKIVNDKSISGPVVLAAPEAITNTNFTTTLASALGRPSFAIVPALALQIALGGDMAHELLLASQRAYPKRLTDAGFTFTHPKLAELFSSLFP